MSSDAEHPTFIPMYTLTALQDPRGHMTRPRPYAIGHKVNSLLFEPSLSTCETWLLPHAWILHILRYDRDDHGESKDQGQAWKRRRKKKTGARQDLPGSSGHPAGRSGPSPDDPDDHPDDPANVPEDTRSCSTKPDHPDGHPDHPDPDARIIRTTIWIIRTKPARMTWAEARVPLRPLSLYI